MDSGIIHNGKPCHVKSRRAGEWYVSSLPEELVFVSLPKPDIFYLDGSGQWSTFLKQTGRHPTKEAALEFLLAITADGASL